MKKKFILALVLSLVTPQAHAASTVKMMGLKPTTSIQLSQNPNDQVAALVTSPTSITVIGTSDSVGFISAYDRTATSLLWKLKLGSIDSIATAAAKGSTGELWVVGASAVKPDPITTPSIPAGTLNPSGVLPDTSTALPQLKELDIWRVTSNGLLLKSYSTVMSDVIYPSSITFKTGKITVVGSIATHALDTFTITMAADGTFGTARISSAKSSSSSMKEIKTTLSIWKSFTTSASIKGLPSWKAKPNSHVLVRYDAKTKAIVGAYITSGEILDLAWEKTIGIITLINYPTGYSIAVVK